MVLIYYSQLGYSSDTEANRSLMSCKIFSYCV